MHRALLCTARRHRNLQLVNDGTLAGDAILQLGRNGEDLLRLDGHRRELLLGLCLLLLMVMLGGELYLLDLLLLWLLLMRLLQRR